jgi:hypothetical protein
VDRWPDREDRTKLEIDAVAGPFAIEHTQIDSFPGQSEDTIADGLPPGVDQVWFADWSCVAVPAYSRLR